MNRIITHLRRVDGRDCDCQCRRVRAYLAAFSDAAELCKLSIGEIVHFEPPHATDYVERADRGSISIRPMYIEPDAAETIIDDVVVMLRSQARELNAAADRLEAAS